MGSPGAISRPPVSTTTNRRPFHSASPYIRSRVVRARSSTIAARASPTTRLNRVLLPTLGLPTRRRSAVPRGARHRQAAPAGGRGVGCDSEVVRPAGCAAASSARSASSAASRARLVGPGELEDPLGDVAQVLDRRRGAAGHAHDPPAVERGRVVEVARVLDLDRVRPGDLAQPGELLGVRGVPAADDHHQLHLAGELEGVLLAPDRDRAHGVEDLELVRAADHERRELLELPGRLGRLGDQGHPLAARDLDPVRLLVDDDRVGREAQQADDLGVLRGAEQDDRVALLDELLELALLLDDPGAGAVDDLEAALLGALEDLGLDAVGADDDRRAVVDVVERLDAPDAEVEQVLDHALVVDDLPEGVRRLAGRGRLLGLVDRLAHAVAEAGALRDSDGLDGSHTASMFAHVRPIRAACGARGPGAQAAARLRADGVRVDAPVAGVEELGDAAHDRARREGLGGPAVDVRRDDVGERNGSPDRAS